MAKERPAPVTYLEDGYEWLYDEPHDVELGKLHPDAPAEAHLVQAISRRLRLEFSDQEDKEWSIRAIAGKCELSHLTIRNLWNGTAWPTLETIAHIEIGIGHTIWGQEHIRPHKREKPRNKP